MKRAITALATFLLMVPLLSTGAIADDATTLLTAIRWGGSGGKGDPVVISTTKKRIVAAYGTALAPTISCSGDGCDPGRPARIEILQRGTWVPWATGTLAELNESSKVLTSRKAASFLVRSTLPAHGDQPAVTSERWSIRFLPATSVTVSGPTVVKPSAANDYQWQFRPGAGSVTVRLNPAAAGRVVELRDVMVEGYPLVGRATTNSRGTATITADFTDVTTLSITVLPTRERAGWNAIATPQSAPSLSSSHRRISRESSSMGAYHPPVK